MRVSSCSTGKSGHGTVFHKDEPGVVPVPSIDDPVWSSSKNDPVAYVKGNTMRVTVKFDVNNPPANPVSGVTVEGVIANLGAFRKTGVTIPSSGTVSITDVDLDAPFPSSGTKFYDPMTIPKTGGSLNLRAIRHWRGPLLSISHTILKF